MCGINLFIDKRTPSDDQIIIKMNRSTHHRGPDFTHSIKLPQNNNTIYIGNNRLQIVDPSSNANQPLQSEDKRYTLSFNGEIYNYKKIKTKLRTNYSFQTNSDTEVLLYHLIENGIQGINELNGMFAFIFHDNHTNKTIVVRDAQGIKPVYFYNNNSICLISSEIKGILASNLIAKEFNEKQIPHYLTYKYVKRPDTFYKNIYELEPGYLLEISENNFQQYKWANENLAITPTFDKKFTQNKIESLLIESVTTQTDTSVPFGLFLSGGIDSTLLLAISSNVNNKPIPSYSICNTSNDKNFGTDDYKYAKRAAKKFNSPYNEIQIDSSLLSSLDELCHTIDQPIGDTALLLTWILAKNASQEIRIALSGAGADEWFAGYNRHKAYFTYLQYFQKNDLLLKLANSTSYVLPDGFSYPYRKQVRLLKKFASSLTQNPEETYNRFRSTNWNQYHSDAIDYSTNSFSLKDAFSHDQKNYLISDILMLTDKTSMASSLEVRVPYLDKNLTEFLSTLPANFFLENGQKWVLKELLKKWGGEEFTKRQKEGFGLPFGKWIREQQHQTILKELSDKKNKLFEYINYDIVSKIIQDHLKFKQDNTSLIWSLVLLSKWIAIEFK